MKLTKFEKIFYGTFAIVFISFIVFQALRYHGIIVVDPYLNLL